MKYFLFFFMISFPALANPAHFSLFLTKSEQAKIQPAASLKSSVPSNTVCLEALMFFDEANWSFWINGQQVRPTSTPDHIKVENVCEDEVDLIWYQNNTPIPLTLKVNEVNDLSQVAKN